MKIFNYFTGTLGLILPSLRPNLSLEQSHISKELSLNLPSLQLTRVRLDTAETF